MASCCANCMNHRRAASFVPQHRSHASVRIPSTPRCVACRLSAVSTSISHSTLSSLSVCESLSGCLRVCSVRNVAKYLATFWPLCCFLYKWQLIKLLAPFPVPPPAPNWGQVCCQVRLVRLLRLSCGISSTKF